MSEGQTMSKCTLMQSRHIYISSFSFIDISGFSMSGGTLNLNLNLGGGGGGKKIGENKVARAVAFKVKKKEGKKKGRKIFVHNVSEKATYVDFQASVVKFGKVTGQSEYSRIIHRCHEQH